MLVGLVRRTALNSWRGRRSFTSAKTPTRRFGACETGRVAQAHGRRPQGNGNGDVLGEMALFGGDVRSTDAFSVTDTKAFRLSRADFEGRLASTDAVQRRMVTIFVARLRDAIKKLSRLRADKK
jgi:CRP-like cAMP-binding protein